MDKQSRAKFCKLIVEPDGGSKPAETEPDGHVMYGKAQSTRAAGAGTSRDRLWSKAEYGNTVDTTGD